MNVRGKLFNWILALGLSTSLFASAWNWARADEDEEPWIKVTPSAKVTAGTQIGYGACPCFRWKVGIQGPGGKIETREFLISSDALFKLTQTHYGFQKEVASRLVTVGAIEALWKGGHIGMGFTGVTLGDDEDLGFNEIMRGGLYAFVNILMSDAVRMDIRSGYDLQKMRVNLGPKISRGILEQKALFKWSSGSWSGAVQASIGMDEVVPLSFKAAKLAGSANLRLGMLTMGDLIWGLNLDVTAERDPWRKLLGVPEDLITTSLFMDLTYLPEKIAGGVQ